MTWAIDNSWPGGAQATVTVRNTGTSALNGWTVGATLAAGQTIQQVYNGAFTQSGQQVTIRNAAYNGNVAPSGSSGFDGHAAQLDHEQRARDQPHAERRAVRRDPSQHHQHDAEHHPHHDHHHAAGHDDDDGRHRRLLGHDQRGRLVDRWVAG